MKLKRHLKTFSVIFALAFWMLATTPVFAEGQREITKRVRFAKGRTSAVLKGAIVRGEVHNYILGAKADQMMIVHITSREKNAVFTVYFSGKQEAVADDATETTDWQGILPADNNYVIEVGSTRGNATYTLEVTIR
jgi:hypothetical protein